MIEPEKVEVEEEVEVEIEGEGETETASPRKKWRQEIRKRIEEKKAIQTNSTTGSPKAQNQDQDRDHYDLKTDSDTESEPESEPENNQDKSDSDKFTGIDLISENTSQLISEKYSFPSDSTLIAALAEDTSSHSNFHIYLFLYFKIT